MHFTHLFVPLQLMKRLVTYLMAAMVLATMVTGCVSRERYAAMRAGLDSINAVNRSGKPFTVQDVEPYVEFFDDHGEANDRLLAHYLLGLAYYDHGEAPMALQCYQDALDCADTTRADCDYAQLSRVYAQMGNVFYSQGLYRKQMEYQRYASRYAWLGKDTLAALMSDEQQSLSYKQLNILDSAVYTAEHVDSLYSLYGYSRNSAIIKGSISWLYLNLKEYKKAKKYMSEYETLSDLFSHDNSIESGREIYYYFNGILYLGQHRLDSALYFFRKELQDGKDFNNQNGGALGLAKVYDELHQPDSAAKYYQYAYAMNDSMYAQQATETVERMQAMYDYSRHQEIARKEKERAANEEGKKRIAFGMLLIVAFMATFIIYLMYLDRKKKHKRYVHNLEKLERTQFEVMQLREHANEYEELISEKEKDIEYLKSEIEDRQQKNRQGHVATIEQIHNSDIYRELKERERNHKALTQEQIRRCRMLIIEKLPDFNAVLLEKQYKLKENDFNVCMLFRLGVKSKEISILLKLSQPRISQICTKVMETVFGETEGGAKELLERLCKYF